MSAKRAEKRQKTAADDVAESSFTKDLEVSFTSSSPHVFFFPLFSRHHYFKYLRLPES